MLMPKRVKRRKQFRGTMTGKAQRGNVISYGEFGIVATEPCWIRSNQIEAARIAMTRYIKRGVLVTFVLDLLLSTFFMIGYTIGPYLIAVLIILLKFISPTP